MLHAMIMAGGGGTRFWPRSRVKRPKQFLTFSGDRTLLQGTVDRVAAQIPPERTWVITGEAYVAETRAQLPELPPVNVIGEPEGRDTAPCVGLAAAIIGKVDPDATIAVMPADHAIEPVQEFRRALHAAEQFVNDLPDKLVTFGIRPTFPSTGYGYIKRGENAGARQNVNASHVVEFAEKPTAEIAEPLADVAVVVLILESPLHTHPTRCHREPLRSLHVPQQPHPKANHVLLPGCSGERLRSLRPGVS